ncbi:hypothetical protein OAT10_00355 [Luminiphilus sp.]|nr:hypothetical protein [Luminiphilus sp.]
MSLTIKIGPEAHKKTITLNARKSVNGDIILYDHPEVDIVIAPRKKRITIIAKERITDDVYDVQDRIFSYLVKKGIIALDSVQGGNVYGTMEAKYQVNDNLNGLNLLLIELERYIKNDKQGYIYNDYFEKMEESFVDPDEENSTELGEIPHEESQGSLRPGYLLYPYGSVGSMSLHRM